MGHAAVELVAGCGGVLLVVFLLLHDLEVEDAWDEHVEEGAHDGRDDHPQVRQDVVRLAVEQRERDHRCIQQRRAQVFRDRLGRSLLRTRTGGIHPADRATDTPRFLALPE